MARRKNRIAEKVKMTGLADKGKAVGRSESGEVFFVAGAVPGDVVDVKVTRKKKSFSQGVVQQFIHLSEHRIDAPCPHFGECGGCKWQNLSYEAQLKYKQQSVHDALTRLASVSPDRIEPILRCDQEFYYRNKLEFSFSNKRWLTIDEVQSGKEIIKGSAVGFHPPGAFDKVVDIHTCLLQDSFNDTLRNYIRKYALNKKFSFYDSLSQKGFFRNMIFRNNMKGEWMVTIVFGEERKNDILEFLEDLRSQFSQITSLNYIINLKQNDSIYDLKVNHFSGDEYLIESLGNLQYKIGPKSFFQTNTIQAKKLYDKVAEYADLSGSENVYDLYTGIGSIALYIAALCKHVTGIEEVEEAIHDAEKNKILNYIEHAHFYAGDVKQLLGEELIGLHGKPDVLITDPPRAGMHADVISTLLSLAPPRLVYVSCNPSTQARDIQLLSGKYNVIKVCPVDMFPHTHHVESVALLTLKG